MDAAQREAMVALVAAALEGRVKGAASKYDLVVTQLSTGSDIVVRRVLTALLPQVATLTRHAKPLEALTTALLSLRVVPSWGGGGGGGGAALPGTPAASTVAQSPLAAAAAALAGGAAAVTAGPGIATTATLTMYMRVLLALVASHSAVVMPVLRALTRVLLTLCRDCPVDPTAPAVAGRGTALALPAHLAPLRTWVEVMEAAPPDIGLASSRLADSSGPSSSRVGVAVGSRLALSASATSVARQAPEPPMLQIALEAVAALVERVPTSVSIVYMHLAEAWPHRRMPAPFVVTYAVGMMALARRVGGMSDRALALLVDKCVELDADIDVDCLAAAQARDDGEGDADDHAGDGDADARAASRGTRAESRASAEAALASTASAAASGSSLAVAHGEAAGGGAAAPAVAAELAQSLEAATKLDSLFLLLLHHQHALACGCAAVPPPPGAPLADAAVPSATAGSGGDDAAAAPGQQCPRIAAALAGATGADVASGLPPQPASAPHLFSLCLAVFERAVLPTHRSKFVQFALFYACAMDVAFAERFVARLLHTVRNPARPTLLRCMCAAYVGSFLARAAFLDDTTVRSALLYLLQFANDYAVTHEMRQVRAMHVERLRRLQEVHPAQQLVYRDPFDGGVVVIPAGCNLEQSLPPMPELPPLDVWLAVVQAALYVTCFHARNLVTREGGLDFLRSLPWSYCMTCPLSPLTQVLESVAVEWLRIAGILQLLAPADLARIAPHAGGDTGGDGAGDGDRNTAATSGGVAIAPPSVAHKALRPVVFVVQESAGGDVAAAGASAGDDVFRFFEDAYAPLQVHHALATPAAAHGSGSKDVGGRLHGEGSGLSPGRADRRSSGPHLNGSALATPPPPHRGTARVLGIPAAGGGVGAHGEAGGGAGSGTITDGASPLVSHSSSSDAGIRLSALDLASGAAMSLASDSDGDGSAGVAEASDRHRPAAAATTGAANAAAVAGRHRHKVAAEVAAAGGGGGGPGRGRQSTASSEAELAGHSHADTAAAVAAAVAALSPYASHSTLLTSGSGSAHVRLAATDAGEDAGDVTAHLPLQASNQGVFASVAAHFPFDPFMLPRSSAHIAPLYRTWGDAALSAEDDLTGTGSGTGSDGVHLASRLVPATPASSAAGDAAPDSGSDSDSDGDSEGDGSSDDSTDGGDGGTGDGDDSESDGEAAPDESRDVLSSLSRAAVTLTERMRRAVGLTGDGAATSSERRGGTASGAAATAGARTISTSGSLGEDDLGADSGWRIAVGGRRGGAAPGAPAARATSAAAAAAATSTSIAGPPVAAMPRRGSVSVGVLNTGLDRLMSRDDAAAAEDAALALVQAGLTGDTGLPPRRGGAVGAGGGALHGVAAGKTRGRMAASAAAAPSSATVVTPVTALGSKFKGMSFDESGYYASMAATDSATFPPDDALAAALLPASSLAPSASASAAGEPVLPAKRGRAQRSPPPASTVATAQPHKSRLNGRGNVAAAAGVRAAAAGIADDDDDDDGAGRASAAKKGRYSPAPTTRTDAPLPTTAPSAAKIVRPSPSRPSASPPAAARPPERSPAAAAPTVGATKAADSNGGARPHSPASSTDSVLHAPPPWDLFTTLMNREADKLASVSRASSMRTDGGDGDSDGDSGDRMAAGDLLPSSAAALATRFDSAMPEGGVADAVGPPVTLADLESDFVAAGGGTEMASSAAESVTESDGGGDGGGGGKRKKGSKAKGRRGR